MLMVIVVAVLGAIVLAAVGWLIATLDEGLPDETAARTPDLGPVEGPLAAADVASLRFRLAFRGYRMTDVDAAVSRLGDALAQTEAELAELRARQPAEDSNG